MFNSTLKTESMVRPVGMGWNRATQSHSSGRFCSCHHFFFRYVSSVLFCDVKSTTACVRLQQHRKQMPKDAMRCESIRELQIHLSNFDMPVAQNVSDSRNSELQSIQYTHDKHTSAQKFDSPNYWIILVYDSEQFHAHNRESSTIIWHSVILFSKVN